MKELPDNTPSPEIKNEVKRVIYFLIACFAIVFTITYINVFIKSRQEYNTKYDFVIKKINVRINGYTTFYDSLDNEYSFASYSFNVHDKLGIEAGDKVFKDYHSKNLVFSRMTDNVYKVYYTQKPNGIIPFSLYNY